MQYAGTYGDMESPPTVYITSDTYADMESPPTFYITSGTYAHELRMHYAAHMHIWKHSFIQVYTQLLFI